MLLIHRENGTRHRLGIGARHLRVRGHVPQPAAPRPDTDFRGDDRVRLLLVPIVVGDRGVRRPGERLVRGVADVAPVPVQKFVRIGRGAMIAGLTGIRADVIPWGIVEGRKGHLAGLNVVTAANAFPS